MKYKSVYFLLSALVIGSGLVFLFLFGLKPSIDFTGGTLWEIKVVSNPSIDSGQGEGEGVREGIAEVFETNEIELSSIAPSGENQYIIRAKPISDVEKEVLGLDLKEEIGEFEDIRFESVGPILGAELLRKTAVALIVAVMMLLGYITIRFRGGIFGVAAILAMLHDSLVLVGVFAILGKFLGVEVDVLFVTALLTVLSFSVHDTIVVYDRIRELSRKYPGLSLENLANYAVSETMVRSVNNSLTIAFMLLVLFLLGGETLRWFAFALLIGTISGTYSSPFTAVPLLLVIRGVLENTRIKRIFSNLPK